MAHIFEEIASLSATAGTQEIIEKINEIVERVNHVWYSEDATDA